MLDNRTLRLGSCRTRLFCHCRRSCALGMLLALCLVGTEASAQPKNRPNLISIVTDDQGQWAMGAYGNKELRSPSMDRIAREGVLFTNAFANTPVCSPSRATFMSGLYPTEFGITDWISPGEARSGVGLQALTWPQVLHDAGYRTAMIGKWHLGEMPNYHPTRRGFDHFMGFLGGGNQPMNPTLEVNGQTQKLDGPLPDILTDDVIAFIKANRNSPFAVCLHFRAPHLPYGPVPERDSALYKDLNPTVPVLPGLDIPGLKESTRAYYASISSVDRNIGRLLQTLDDEGLASNTLVLFTSDHGYNEGRHTIKTKGNGYWMAGGVRGPTRPNMWDTSIRIPLALRWPGVIAPGRVVEEMVSNIDMFRTILGALGVPVPRGAKARGVDFSPLLRGQTMSTADAVFGQYDLHNSGLAYLRMIRTSRYKYVRPFHANMMDELYDLAKDPDEKENLLRNGMEPRAGYEQVHKDLQARLLYWMKSVRDPLLQDSY